MGTFSPDGERGARNWIFAGGSVPGLVDYHPKRDGWARAGILTLGISIVGILLAFFSGDPAVNVINGQPRTSGKALMQHHVRSLYATALAVITGIFAAITFVKARNSAGNYSGRWLKVVLITTLLTLGALAWTGLAGGRINHPELQQPDDQDMGPAHPH